MTTRLLGRRFSASIRLSCAFPWVYVLVFVSSYHFMCSVWKIETRHVHSGINHLHERVNIPARRTESTNDFGVAVRKSSVADNSVKTKGLDFIPCLTSNYNRYTTLYEKRMRVECVLTKNELYSYFGFWPGKWHYCWWFFQFRVANQFEYNRELNTNTRMHIS